MRTIERTTQFKKDFRRELKGPHRQSLDKGFADLITVLAEDGQLAARHRDHALTGDWKDHRDCHLKPDLLLIYRKSDPNTLQLVRLGSHSELGL
jgi:mRNA interferase YafQ